MNIQSTEDEARSLALFRDGVVHKAARDGWPLDRATMYVPWFSCAECSRAIIQAGIKRVIGHQRMFDETPERWRKSVDTGLSMLREAGVELEFVQGKLDLEPIRFNSQLWVP